jgi:branched-chain amino acid transport system permease protein
MIEAFINGITRGAIYALIALGYTMVYGILGMINFAHGEIFMIGMFAGIIFLAACTTLGWTAIGLGLCLAMAFLFAMMVSAAYGYTNERIAYRPLRKAHVLSPLISAIGMSIFLQNFVMNFQSKEKVDFPREYSELLTSHEISLPGGTQISCLQIFIIAASVLLMTALTLFIHRTRLGKAMRATSQDKTMASLVGIPIDRVISVTFVIGSALAAAAGMMVAMYNGIAKFDLGYVAGIKAFTAAVLGGIGNIPGAMLGGFLIGLAEDITAYKWGSDWKDVIAFLILIIVLVVRPKGILGERVAEKV